MRFAAALLLAAGVHAAIGVAIGLVMAHSGGVEPARLDLSSVDLSFAEEEAVAPAAPVPAMPPPPPPERAAPPPPEAPQPETDPFSGVALPASPEPPEPPVPLAETKPELPPAETAEPPPAQEPAPPAPAPKQARVDAPPRPTRTIKPEYPLGSRRRGEEGGVVLEIAVDARGGVEHVEVVQSSGFAELDAAALRAARAARFTPARQDGRAVAARARLTLDFKLK